MMSNDESRPTESDVYEHFCTVAIGAVLVIVNYFEHHANSSLRGYGLVKINEFQLVGANPDLNISFA